MRAVMIADGVVSQPAGRRSFMVRAWASLVSPSVRSWELSTSQTAGPRSRSDHRTRLRVCRWVGAALVSPWRYGFSRDAIDRESYGEIDGGFARPDRRRHTSTKTLLPNAHGPRKATLNRHAALPLRL